MDAPTKEDLPKIAEKSLGDLSGESGGILYSSHETIKPGDIYFLGYNPGGSDGNAIIESIKDLLSKPDNNYLDEEWENKQGECKKGEAPLQKRIDSLFKEIGYDLREVCSSNLIFVQSPDADHVDYKYAERCWPVHQALLKIIQPKLILIYGNGEQRSAYRFIRNKYVKSKGDGDVKYLPTGYGSWNFKGFKTMIDGHQFYIGALPHLSYPWYPSSKNQTEITKIIKWIKSKLSS